MINGYIGYTKALTDRVIEKANNSSIVMDQVNNKETDLITGKKFKTDDYVGPTDEEKIASAKEYINGLTPSEKANISRFVQSQPSDEELQQMIDYYMKPEHKSELFATIKSMSPESGSKEDENSAVAKALEGLTDEQYQQYAPDILKNILPYIYAADKASELADIPDSELAEQLSTLKISDEIYIKLFDTYTPEEISDFTYDDVLFRLGYASTDNPASIRIYAKSFEDKDAISDIIEEYNDGVSDSDEIKYTDYVKLLMSSITSIITGISYLLIAFVGISLVVSSIMIGIITYISVLERTREIGILRAIGASKHDVSTVFNAETLLVGLAAGLIGIGISVLFTIPINLIIHNVTSLDTLRAHVPVVGALVLIGISMFLTFIAGLIPSRLAAKKDPVVALRTE
jgi:putative ABC transport system permease protein